MARLYLTPREIRKEERKRGVRRRFVGWATLWPVVVPVALAWWAYHDALRGEFLFDDIPAVKTNVSLESIGGFWDAAFGEKHSPISNRPLVCLSFAINYQFSKLDPFGYHVVNLVMHCANAALLWGVLRRTLVAPNLNDAFDESQATWAATAVATLWAVHPLTGDAVVYVTQRTTLMMSFFLLAMLYGTLRSVTDVARRRWWKGLAVAACAAAMLCKEEAVAAPILVVLFDRAFHYESFRSASREHGRLYAGLAASWVLLLVVVLLGPHNPTIGYDTVPQVNAWESLLTQAPVVIHYIQLTIWPRPLIAAYDWEVVRSLGDVLLPALAVVGLLAASVFLWFRRPHWGWLAAWFFLLLAPTSSIMPIVSETVAERRMYLPMLSLLVPVVLAAFWLFEKLVQAVLGSQRARPAYAVAPFAALAYFAAAEAADHARLFGSDRTLFRDAYQKNALTGSGFMTSNLLHAYAKVLIDEKRSDEAIAILERAVACEPPLNASFVNLAALYVDRGRWAEAEKIYSEALTREPMNANAWSNFAKLRLDQYQADPPEKRLGPNDPRMLQGYEMVNRAIAIDARDPNYYSNLGSISYFLGRAQEAVNAWSKALELDPSHFSARSNRAIVLADQGRAADAVREFDMLLAREPNNVGVLVNQARAYGVLKDLPAATQRLQQALKLDPQNPNALQLLEQLTKTGSSPDAQVLKLRCSRCRHGNWSCQKDELCPMTGSLDSHRSREELVMIIVAESASALKGFLARAGLSEVARAMVLRMVLAFVGRRGRMSCSQAAVSVAAENVHRGELTRFLARPRWQQGDFNAPLRAALLAQESRRGEFLFLVDATLVSQAGKKTQNTFSTNNRNRGRRTKYLRYGKKKIAYKQCHSFTFGLLITPSGLRIPFQIPHYTREYCARHGVVHRTTAEAAAELIRTLPLPAKARVTVIGDTAYDAEVVQRACAERGFTWITPANPERVYQGARGERPQVRTRLQDWKSLSLKTVRLRASTGQYAAYRRLSKWRIGPKQKPRAYYAYQEKREVRSVGRVQLVFSTTKPNLSSATPDDVKILMTNATHLSVGTVIELYSLRWQIELFFKELKSTLGFDQYRFQSFAAVRAWVEIAVTTVLFLEYRRAQRLRDRRLTADRRTWWTAQRLHGLCAAFRQECAAKELRYFSARLKTPGGIAKLQRLLAAATPPEFRTAA